MDETIEDKVKRFKTSAALIQAGADRDWSLFNDNVEELEGLIEAIADPFVRGCVELVIIEVYLKRIQRDLDNYEAGFYDD
jgi:hypothetical protein